MSTPELNHFFTLARRPEGLSTRDNFKRGSAPIPELSDGEFLIQTELISLDPTNRIWMSDMDQYMPPVEVGDVMRAGGLGTVVKSRHPDFAVGDVVTGLMGWQTFPVSTGNFVWKAPVSPELPKSALLSQMTGATAYIGLLDIGQPQPGETLVVSAAAGAVGTIACQIGKIKELRVIGIAGRDEKCRMLETELGVDGTINYKTDHVGDRLDALCPDGIDIYFENVGGELLDTILPRMNNFGRIPLCGLIAGYNAVGPIPGPTQFSQILMKRLTVQGFIVGDRADRMAEATAALGAWAAAGTIVYKDTIVEGFDALPDAMNMLFTGENIGKLMVKV